MNRVAFNTICKKGSSSLRQKDIANDGPYPVYGASGIVGYSATYQNEVQYVAVIKDGAGVGRARLCEPMSSVLGTMQALIPNEGVDCDYLLYLVDSMKLGSGFTGTTIPHIYFKDYGKRLVTAYDSTERHYIASTLNALESLMAICRDCSSKLDQLVKSRFVEMFVYSDFPIVRLGDYCVSINNGMARRGNDPDGSIVLRLVELQEGFLDYSSVNRISLTAKEKSRFILHDGDILFARVNGNPDNVGRCAAFFDVGEPVFHNDHIIRASIASNDFEPSYLTCFINGAQGREQINMSLKTSAGQYTINQDGIKGIHLPKPPLTLQQEFAAFVQQVDKSRFAVQQAIDQLELLKAKLMQEYFG